MTRETLERQARHLKEIGETNRRTADGLKMANSLAGIAHAIQTQAMVPWNVVDAIAHQTLEADLAAWQSEAA